MMIANERSMRKAVYGNFDVPETRDGLRLAVVGLRDFSMNLTISLSRYFICERCFRRQHRDSALRHMLGADNCNRCYWEHFERGRVKRAWNHIRELMLW